MTESAAGSAKRTGRGGPRANSGGPRPNSGGKRAGAGRKPNKVELLTVAPPVEPALDAVHEPLPPALDGGLAPLAFLLAVMRDNGADPKLRIQAARIAAPFCHGKGSDDGKKGARKRAGQQVAAVSKFALPAPPKLVVSNS